MAHSQGSFMHAVGIPAVAHLSEEEHMSDEQNPATGGEPQNTRDEDAVFKGWQETGRGSAFPLYTITATDHPSRGSTVSEQTLHKLNLQVPESGSAKGPADVEQEDNTKYR
jgi:hypothetical protein